MRAEGGSRAAEGELLRVGVVAATPRHLPAALLEALAEARVAQILHAGDVTHLDALAALEEIAPLALVGGHEDIVRHGGRMPAALETVVGGARILVVHVAGSPGALLPAIAERLAHDPPEVVVHGHPPRPDAGWIGGTLFVNPGSAGGLRGAPLSCAILEIEGPGRVGASVLDLGGGEASGRGSARGAVAS